MVKSQIGKSEAIMLTGAGVGMVQSYLTRDVIDAMFGPIPMIGDYLGVWGSYSTFFNIVVGGAAFVLSTFTGAIKNQTARTFLQGYGFTTLLGGIFNGVFPNIQLASRLRVGRSAPVRVAPQAQVQITVFTHGERNLFLEIKMILKYCRYTMTAMQIIKCNSNNLQI